MLGKEMRDLINRGKVYDLGQPYFTGMPHHPNHPPFAFSLTKKHGDVIYPGEVSASNCIFTTGGRGDPLDALGHISKKGKVFGNVKASTVQDYRAGLRRVGIDATPPVVKEERGSLGCSQGVGQECPSGGLSHRVEGVGKNSPPARSLP